MTFIPQTHDYVVHVRSRNADEAPMAVVLPMDLDAIPMAMSFMRLVLDTDLTLFKPARHKWAGPEYSELGRMLPHLDRFAGLFASGNQFHPHLAFFLEEYRRHPIRRWHGGLLRSVSGPEDELAREFDDFIATMRTRAKEVRLRKRAANWESKLRKNDKRLHEVESQMFAKYTRVVAVRLDCHRLARVLTSEELNDFLARHHQRQPDFERAMVEGTELPCGFPHKIRVPFEQIQADREKFFRNMKGKRSLFRHLVAYVWRIEFTPAAGYHLHLALFFDGSQVKGTSHKWLAGQICDYWAEAITEGKGYAINVNKNWDERDPNCGIGVIDRLDARKRHRLLHLLGYLNKVNQQVLVMPYEGCNTFGAGIIKGHRKGYGGRPRVRGIGAGHEGAPS